MFSVLKNIVETCCINLLDFGYVLVWFSCSGLFLFLCEIIQLILLSTQR